MDFVKLGEMKYLPTREHSILAMGNYRGCSYYVLSMGTHPCAYIDYKDILLTTKEIDNIDCHGGVTYTDNVLALPIIGDIKGNFIGWDYGHYGDYMGYDDLRPPGIL